MSCHGYTYVRTAIFFAFRYVVGLPYVCAHPTSIARRRYIRTINCQFHKNSSHPIRPSPYTSSSPFSSPLPLFDSSVTLPFVRSFCTVVCLLCIDHGEHCRAVSLLLSAHTGAGLNAREEELVPTSFGRSFANFAFVVDSSPDTCARTCGHHHTTPSWSS